MENFALARGWRGEVWLSPVKLANEPLDLSHVVPSNVRQWEPDQIALPSAEIDGDRVTVHNIRNNIYVSENMILRHLVRRSDVRGTDIEIDLLNLMPDDAPDRRSDRHRPDRHVRPGRSRRPARPENRQRFAR